MRGILDFLKNVLKYQMMTRGCFLPISDSLECFYGVFCSSYFHGVFCPFQIV